MNMTIIDVAVIGFIVSSNIVASAFECTQEESTVECEASIFIKWSGLNKYHKRDIFIP